MVRYLDKEKEMGLLDELFDILYRNMETIAPLHGSFQEEKTEWIACIGSALKKPPRQMLLLYAGETLAGFFMFYISGDILMVEEVQVSSPYQRTVLTAELFRFIRYRLLPQVHRVEAYADHRNTVSQHLMSKLGMEQIGDDGRFLHFRINAEKI